MSEQRVPSFGMQRQLALFMAGVQGQKPQTPISMAGLRQQAAENMRPEAYGYLEGGAGTATMQANRSAFDRWNIVPRMLRGVAQPDLRTEVLGHTLRAPLLLAPIGVQGIIHEEGENATAQGAAAMHIPMILSTVSSKPMEEVAGHLGDTHRWFQLYWGRDDAFTVSLLQRAEKAGFSALVVTLDTFQLAWRERDLEHAYLPFMYLEGLGNYLTDPVFRAALPDPPEENPLAAVQLFASWFTDASLTWERLAFLRENTRLPILLKGILHPDDARKAMDYGADGLVVSNHGGRQMGGAIGALAALPDVVAAVGAQTTILFDSGIRSAADVFKAVALGADAVLLGRPYAYGLAANGADGVRDVLHNLLAELDLTLALAGCARIAEVNRDMLVEVP